MNFFRWSYRLIIPKKYKRLPPGSYTATIDKIIRHRDGHTSIRFDNIERENKEGMPEL